MATVEMYAFKGAPDGCGYEGGILVGNVESLEQLIWWAQQSFNDNGQLDPNGAYIYLGFKIGGKWVDFNDQVEILEGLFPGFLAWAQSQVATVVVEQEFVIETDALGDPTIRVVSPDLTEKEYIVGTNTLG